MSGLDEIRSRLAAAKSDLEKARERRQRSGTQLEAALAETVAELELTRSRLEGELMRAEEELKEAWAAAGGQPRGKAGKAESRVPELEGQLAAERERREDLELALELLQKQQAEDARRLVELERKARASGPRAPQGERVIPTEQPQRDSGRPVDAQLKRAGQDPEDGWGVSLDAFPLVDDEPQTQQTRNSAGTGGAGPRSLFRRRRRDRG